MNPLNPNDIERKLHYEGITEAMAERLSLSELNSFLMEVHRQKSKRLKPSDLLSGYSQSRFVGCSDLDPLRVLEMKSALLMAARKEGFIPLELSPLVPFGCCSALAPVDQNNIVTALRGTEVISDITNVLTLEACMRKQDGETGIVELCASERTVRAQSFDNPNFSAHFQLFGMVSAGRDTGNFSFEQEKLLKHLHFYIRFLENRIKQPSLRIRLTPVADPAGEIHRFERIRGPLSETLSGYPVIIDPVKEKFSYYKDLRLGIFLLIKGEEHHIVDGGFTDWSQKLLSNKKERLLTSGLGMEYLLRILS